MNAKCKRIVQMFLIASAVAVVLFSVGFLIGVAFEPLDPLPRADRTAQCSNNTSVILYQRKTGWFASEAEWSVKQFDRKGNFIRRQTLFTLPHWNDSEMHQTPDEFCDDKYWTRRQTPPLHRTQPNKSLDAGGTTGLGIDHSLVTWLRAAASTQTLFGLFSMT